MLLWWIFPSPLDGRAKAPWWKCHARSHAWYCQTNGGTNGFKYFWFSPLLEEMIQFDWYYSNGLKPPTRFVFRVLPTKNIKPGSPADLKPPKVAWSTWDDSWIDQGFTINGHTVDGNQKSGEHQLRVVFSRYLQGLKTSQLVQDFFQQQQFSFLGIIWSMDFFPESGSSEISFLGKFRFGHKLIRIW